MSEDNVLKSSNSQCANCGGNLTFNPATQKLKCLNCGSEFGFNRTRKQVKHLIKETNENASSHREWAKDLKAVRCNTCGAKVMLSGLEITQKCPYCGSDYVVDTDSLAGLKPDVVLPFSITEQQAGELFKKVVKKKLFVPRSFKKNLPIENIRGLYLPIFTFDADAYVEYDGELEKDKEKKNSKGETVKYTETFRIYGDKNFYQRDWVSESSSKISQKDINELLPFDFNETYAYTNDFLRGYPVEHYEESMMSNYRDTQECMKTQMKSDILSQYDYDRVKTFNMKISWSNELYSYRLMPVYCIDLKYKNKPYNTYVNGQTGKVGKGYPVSLLKKILFFGGIAIIAIGIIILLLWANKAF